MKKTRYHLSNLRFEQNTMGKKKKKNVASSIFILQNDIFPLDIFPSFLGIVYTQDSWLLPTNLVSIPSHQPTPSWHGRASHSFSSVGVGKKKPTERTGKNNRFRSWWWNPWISYHDHFVVVWGTVWVWLFSSLVGGLNRPIFQKMFVKMGIPLPQGSEQKINKK